MSKRSTPNDLRTTTLLVVDDDDVDVEAILRSLKRERIANPVEVARDGIEALDKLRGTDTQPALAGPIIVLLDINMPRMNGLELLEEIRSDEALKGLTVFMLTTSDHQDDVFRAYDMNVAGYIVKSAAGDGFIQAIGLLDHYWRLVELPEN